MIWAGPGVGGERNVAVTARGSGIDVAAMAALAMAARRYPPFRKSPMLQEPSSSTDQPSS